MSFLATALRAYPGVGTVELYRKCWRLTDSKGKPIGNNNMLLVTGLKEKMYLVNLDTNQKSQYALTTADAAADDWVVKTKSVSLQGMPNQPFFFYSAFHKSLNQNKLITLSEWKEERFVCISGAEQTGAFGMVYFNGSIFINHTDWYPTPAELLDNNWYSLDRYAPITITKELQTSYLDYAMSVIVSRALPDVRDGFKPVHRRVIYAQHALGNTKQNAFKKSARVVGDVIGKYHPHGDCLSGDTLMYGLDGNNYTLKDLTEKNVKSLDVLAFNPETNAIECAKAHSFRIGQHTDMVYNLLLSDNSVLRCTANHPFFVYGEGWVKAEKLQLGHKLVSASVNTNGDYRTVVDEDTKVKPIYSLTHELPSANHIRHHINHDRHDDRPDNIKVCTREEHALLHKDYLVGLANGHITMKSSPEWMAAIKSKNSALMIAYNKALPIIKAVNHIQFLKDNGYEVTPENYSTFSKESTVYNVTKLDTLIERYDIQWSDLITLHANGGYRLDTSAAFGHTEALREEQLAKSGNTLMMRRGSMLSKMMEVINIIFRDNLTLNWTGYKLARDKHLKENGLGIAIYGRNAPAMDRLIKEFGAEALDDLVAIASNQGHGLYVKSVYIENVEQEPMYDFTVDGLENAYLVTSEREGRFTLLAAHNSAVYEAIVRMAQPFSLRYPLIDGQGNFGSVDGDSAAAMRYTEVRMENITGHMLSDLEKDTVDWVDNYDGSEIIPDVLPTRFPNLVINGSSGIAVAMATNMPPHNLTETIKATIALIQNPNLSNKELFAIIPAPDFPTGGTIRGLSGAQKAMATGKGRVIITSKFHMEQKTNGIMNIVFSEIPYGVNKARIITKIAEAVTSKKLEGIGHIQDESDREGMRIVVTCKRDSNADVVLNNLLNGDYGLEVGFSVNNMAIVNGLPKLFSMREMLFEFIKFRREVVMRRTRFEIEEMRKRAHILEGQIAALLNIDVCIETIKKSKDTASAIEALGKLVFDGKGIRKILGKYDRIDPNVELGFSANEAKYRLHPSQAKDIVNMRLARLTGLEKEKLCAEFLQIIQNIAYLWTIINDLNVLNTVIINECLQTIPPNDQRKTIIDLKEHRVATVEELLPDQPIVVTMSKMGWIKQQELSTYNAQRRGGRGKTATALKEDDYVRLMITASSHQTIMLLTSLGRIHCVKGYELPSGSSGGRGKPIQNHIALQDGEEVTAIIPIREYGENEYMVIATRQGKIKRTSLDQFSNIRSTGIIAIALNDGDAVIGCKITDGSSEIMLFSSDSKAIRFEEQQVRAMGRQAGGIAGITLSENAYVNSLIVAHDDADVLCVCANGYGKRTKVAEFSKHNRGGKGLISINASDRNGAFIGAVAVESDSEIMICSDDGIVIRTDSQGIAKTSRNAQGVKLINLAKGARVSAVETINIIDTSITKAKPLVKKKRISK